jgi:hypothetical protein
MARQSSLSGWAVSMAKVTTWPRSQFGAARGARRNSNAGDGIPSSTSTPSETGGLLVVDTALTVEQAADQIVDILAQRALTEAVAES